MVKISQDYHEKAKKRLLESAEVKQKTAKECIDSIIKASELIIDTFNSGNKVLICGNGGSAADSQHMAGEFVCVLNKNLDRPGLPAIALTTDTSILTAHANDIGFEKVFERQVQALGKPNDLLIGISTSGNSKNVIAALMMAKSQNLHTLVIAGTGGVLSKLADIAISIPSTNTQYIQETHLAVEHLICEIVEDYIFRKKQR